MLDNINILKIASSFARHAATRHEIITQNIANADTNGYKAKDLEPFADAYQRMTDKNGTIKERGADNGDTPWRAKAVIAPGIESPNGNTVSIEDQMIRSAEAQGDHETATLIYRKTMEILRTSLGRGA